MKKYSNMAMAFILFGMGLVSCEVVGGIFKAGMYWGIFLVVALVALIIYLLSRTRK